MPEELIPIVLFVCLFGYLSVRALTTMFQNMSRTKAKLNFMQGLVDRGFSAPEIERIMRACSDETADGYEYKEASLNSRMTHPVPPVKQALHS